MPHLIRIQIYFYITSRIRSVKGLLILPIYALSRHFMMSDGGQGEAGRHSLSNRESGKPEIIS